MISKAKFACLLFVSSMFIAAGAAVEASPSNALTIYSSARPGAIPAELYRPAAVGGRHRNDSVPGYAVVRQGEHIMLSDPRSTVRFTDVAALIDPTTVSFQSLTDPDTRVLEQNYQFDLVSTEKLMERYVDREITVEQTHGDTVETVKGTLLSVDGGLVLGQEKGGVQVLRGASNIRFPELPGGLITRPTLVWDVATDSPGKHEVRVRYQTAGMTWWADYNLVYHEGSTANECVLDVGAWVSIINQSGAGYENARLKLVAGDVHRATQPSAPAPRYEMMARAAPAESGFEEKAFFEYHLYTLGRRTTLPDNSTKQIELFPAAHGVQCEKKLVYYGLSDVGRRFAPNPVVDRNYGTQSNKKVDIYLGFENKQANGLGIPLPAGRVRVNKEDAADGSLEFIGEDVIDHTPRDEDVLIELGSAFDVVGERKQVDFRVDNTRRWMQETIEIQLRNHKEQSVRVEVKENLYRWVNWRITDHSHDYQRRDARTVVFPVQVPADGEVTVRYTARYTW